MKILVTGGAGFIGSHLCELLLQRGDDVTALDTLSTGHVCNLKELNEHPRFRLVEGSVTDNAVLEPLIAASDHVYHLAAAVGVRLIIEQPVSTIETNILGTEAVLKLCARYNKKVLLASTSEVYGKNSNVPFSEDDDSVFGATVKSRWSYACSKAIDEFLALAYHRERALPVVIVRFFNTVGPRQTGRYGMVVPNLVRQALSGQPLTVYGDGKQSRCFTHVRDSIRCQIALMDEPGAVGNIYNLGGSEEVTIEALARRIVALTDSRSELRFIPYEEAYETGFEDMRRRVPDTSRLRNLLGFAPDSQLDEIILDVAAFFRSHPALS